MTLQLTEAQRKALVFVVSLAIEDEAINDRPTQVLHNILKKLKRS